MIEVPRSLCITVPGTGTEAEEELDEYEHTSVTSIFLPLAYSAYTENSDVFSLGIILYECCFGEYPFPYVEEDYREIKEKAGEDIHIGYLQNIMAAVPEYLMLEHCGGMAGLIIHLLKGMLEYDPAKRFSMNAVITHLNILMRVQKVYNVELTDERCFKEEILQTYKQISKEYSDLFTLSDSRIGREFEHDFYFEVNDKEEDILLEMLKEDLELENTEHGFENEKEKKEKQKV